MGSSQRDNSWRTAGRHINSCGGIPKQSWFNHNRVFDMKILVCGDRNWTDGDFIEDTLDDFLEAIEIWDYDFLLIEGGCRGADTFALRWAQQHKHLYKDIPADWDKYGKPAGPIRNRLMLDEKPDIVFAFHNDIDNSKGTKDCVFEANRRGIEVRIISSKVN